MRLWGQPDDKVKRDARRAAWPALAISRLPENDARWGHTSDVGFGSVRGGKIERGERIAEAAGRERLEETGVAARAVEVFTAVDAIEQAPDASTLHHSVPIAVRCEWVAGDPAAHDDALDARWLGMDTLLSARTVKSVDVATVAVQTLSLAGTRTRGT